VITRGCSGYLRQEFKEQELLDEVTKLRYKGKLPPHIEAGTCSVIIQEFQLWRGIDFVPSKTHATLRWSSGDPMGLISSVNDSQWQIVDKKKNHGKTTGVSSSFMSAKGSLSVNNKKHTFDYALTDSSPPAKKVRGSQRSSIISSPLGLTWDKDNYSCGYDSLLVILFDIWKDNPQAWSGVLRDINRHCALLSKGFNRVIKGSASLEQVRDTWRNVLYTLDPETYPRGTHGINVAGLAEEMLKMTESIASSQHQCSRCDYAEDPINDKLTYVLHADGSTKHSTNNWINNLSQTTHRRCPICKNKMKQIVFYNEIPDIVILEYPMKNIQTSHNLEFMTEAGGTKVLKLRGIVYHGGYHFTSRIVFSKQDTWYHNGINTGKKCLREGTLVNLSNDTLKVCRGRDLTLAVYAYTF